jgi:hypothetical protein
MEEMVFLLAAAMSESDLIQELKSAIAEYEINPEAKPRVMVMAMLLLSKDVSEEHGEGMEGAMKMVEEVKKVKRVNELLNPGEQ